jgi:diguanylate cyclase (GGDEF)-like protein/PAS domain S-box-containing protein
MITAVFIQYRYNIYMIFTRINIISFLFFIIFSLFMLIVFRNYILDKQHSVIDANIINTQQYIKKSIEYLINEKKQDYFTLSATIFSDKKVIKALEQKDRNNFYKHVKRYFERAKKRDVKFWGLHIILANNMSFIRVHKPEVTDKLILKGNKPLVDRVNDTRQTVTSFDAGKFGYFLRVVTPIFSSDNKYLGAAEFSVSIDSLTEYIKNNFAYESMFLIKNTQNKSYLNDLAKTPSGLVIFKSTDDNFFKNNRFDIHNSHYPHDLHTVFIGENTKEKGSFYSTAQINLSQTATLAIAFEVTNIINEQRTFDKNVTTLISFVIFIFSIIWFFTTKLYLKDRKQVASQLQKVHGIISENVIFSNTDLDGVITEVSDAFCHVSGYSRKQLIGSSHSKVRHPETENAICEELWRTIKADKIWKGELQNLKPNGESYWVAITISPKCDKNNNKIGYMSIKQNITDRKIIEAISITDGLCEIYNRRYFDTIFPKIINAAKRKNELVCLIIMDVDYFKQYNDTYGHQMGDDVLKSIAKSLKESFIRADDYCFRLGGEEFGIIFKVENKQLALDFANTIRTSIENLKISHNSSDVSKYITASFGVMCKHAIDIKDADEIYKNADDLLYKAKGSGRNKVEINIDN